MSQPAARLTDDERRILTDFCRHMATCRKCTNRDGTTATFRGCMAGHLTAVRSATILARFFPPPAPPAKTGQGAMF